MRSIHTKRVIATSLFCVLLFLHAEKVLHSHVTAPVPLHSSEATVSVLKGCSICDFQLCKEGILPTLIGQSAAILTDFRSISLPVSFYSSFQISYIAERGPPVMVGIVFQPLQ